ncbi:MAG: sensor domain-containing diguanylate cyclase [Actinobacteria bacterium]|nr:sensor domain-containing diguanylate cyclase [Actinomycetota bacterium]
MYKNKKLVFDQIDIVYFLIRTAGIIGTLIWTIGSNVSTQTFYSIFSLMFIFFLYSIIFYLINFRLSDQFKTLYLYLLIPDLIVVTLLTNLTGGHQSYFFIAYYLLVILHSFYYSFPVGLGVTALAVLFDFTNSYVYFTGGYYWGNGIARIGFLWIFGISTTLFSEHESQKKREAEDLNWQLIHHKEELEKSNAELNNRLAEIFFIHELSKAFSSTIDSNEVSGLIVDGANGILGAEISCVYILNPTKNEFYLKSIQGTKKENLRPNTERNEAIIWEAVNLNQVINRSDLAGFEYVTGIFKNDKEIKSLIVVPLGIKGNMLGVLGIASTTKRVFSEDEIDRLVNISNMASLALHNALLHEEIERLSITDRLTDLYNHGYFQQRLKEELERAVRFKHPLSILLMDIDYFKKFNDTFGHPKGDQVLKRIAAILKGNMRDVDIAARYGGEEFVAVLPETDKDGILVLAERIRRKIEEEEFEGNKDGLMVSKTVSIGVAGYPEDITINDPAQLIEKADQALYQAKNTGRNKVIGFDKAVVNINS